MKNIRGVKKPDLKWLIGLALASQTIFTCLIVIFAAVGRRFGWGDVLDATPTNGLTMVLVWSALSVSAAIRYLALYLVSWSFVHDQRRSELVYRFGFFANTAFDLLQAYILISVFAAPVVDGGFALLIIPLGGFWILVGTSVLALVGRLLRKGA